MILCIGVAAALLLVLSEVTNLVVVDVTGAGCEDAVADPDTADSCEITGGEQHSFALVPIAFLCGVMAVGAGLGASRPAGFAVLIAGLLILGIALLGDLPETSDTGQVGTTFANAEANPGIGFWLELAAGVLAIAAGVLRLRSPQVSRAT